MNCSSCNSDRLGSINAKCNDMCFASVGPVEKDGYVPKDMGIGGGDYVDFSFCLDCGKIQGQFPLKKTTLEEQSGSEETPRSGLWIT